MDKIPEGAKATQVLIGIVSWEARGVGVDLSQNWRIQLIGSRSITGVGLSWVYEWELLRGIEDLWSTRNFVMWRSLTSECLGC